MYVRTTMVMTHMVHTEFGGPIRTHNWQRENDHQLIKAVQHVA